LIRDQVVPVVVDGRWVSRFKDSAEGRFFWQCWGNRGTENTFFAATAGGKPLPRGLEDWKRLPDAERAPGAVRVEELPADKRVGPQPPPGGLIARVTIRALVRDDVGRFSYERLAPLGEGRIESEPTRDHLWLTKLEWQSMVPDSPKKGDEYALPDLIADRLVRYHLMVVPDCVTGFWTREAVRFRHILLRVEHADAEQIRLRLEGSVLIAAPVGVDVKESRDGYDARLAGFLTYDRTNKRFTRFDVIALGSSWESNENRPRINPTGRRWVGVAFELADPAVGGGEAPLTYPYFLLRDGNDYFGTSR
jgi:hypothetical protein